MKFPKKYNCLIQNEFIKGEFKLVPIRYEDRMQIMKWRNEQIYHLRQSVPLTKEKQDTYFNNTVKFLFEQERPNQILFSFLKGEECIGYGGLVHINWLDKNSEISFIMNTSFEKKYFSYLWCNFIQLLQKVAFKELNIKKIFTYAFDLRPHLYKIFEGEGFEKEAILKDHCYFNNEFKNVIIHSKINKNFKHY